MFIPHPVRALDGPHPQLRRLIERPTARTLPKGSFDLDLRIFTKGGILGGIGVGLMDRLTLGFSFGGTQIIGNEEINWNPRVEFAGKYLMFEAAKSLPAIAIGFESQGYGAYDDRLKRYTTKSSGFFAAATKNYQTFLGSLGLHGGINLSLENEDGDSDPSGYIGVDKSLNDQISILAEYNLLTDQNGPKTFTLGDGHLNVAIRWTFSNQLDFELDLKNLLKQGSGQTRINREVRMVLLEYL